VAHIYKLYAILREMKTSMTELNQPITSTYIELLKKVLIDYFNIDSYEYYPLTIENPNWKTAILFPFDKLLRTRNFIISKRKYVIKEKRINGYDWPANATTMIGLNRLNNIEYCIHSINKDNIEGDLIEAGVWRGGATILMRAILKDLNILNKKVWVADSFKGLPKPDIEKYKSDKGNRLNKLKILNVSLEEVKRNFEKYDLLDEQVVFLEGWFKDTLAKAPITKLALIRLDADMYESTFQALENLYPKLSLGGYVIIDDYNAFQNCKQAVDDYRKKNNISNSIIEIDREAIYWRKEL
jgi:O-methyltransferase